MESEISDNIKERLEKLFLEFPKCLTEEQVIMYDSILHEEQLIYIANAIFSYFFISPSSWKNKMPYFDQEINMDLSNSFQYFEKAISICSDNDFKLCDVNAEAICTVFKKMPIADALLIMGQRLTSGSIRDETAIPPLKELVIKKSFEPYNEHVSKATRAWEKHVGRTDDQFWGEITGRPKDKELKVKELLLLMLDEKTWWNVFTHYEHGAVYEIRVASGHGVRWKKENLELIGFLEPFQNGQNYE